MSKQITLTCDCGCGATTTTPDYCGWFTISQYKHGKTEDDDEPKLERDVHLSSLLCIKKWSDAAVIDIPKLQKIAARLHPRGTFRSDAAPGLYI